MLFVQEKASPFLEVTNGDRVIFRETYDNSRKYNRKNGVKIKA